MSDRSHLRDALIMGASVMALAGLAAPALAQSAAPAPAAPAAPAAAPDEVAGGDVIVTAEHRQTRLQKVPVAVSVFTGASRDRVGISTVQEVTNFAPGFVYDPANVHAYIRGVGRQSINLTDDARVATYEDEFYVYSPYGLDKSSLFLSQEQIERGPQNVGGRNAAAGSIDSIDIRPTDQPYAEVRGTVGNYDHYEVEGAVSGQVAPGLDLRLSGYDNNQNEGYLKNVANGPSEDGEIHEWYIEGQADYKIGSNADLWGRVFFSNWNNRGDAGARNGVSTGSWDETNLTDANLFVGSSLFVNPNFGYTAILPGAQAGRNPLDPQAISVTLANPGIFNNPQTISPTSNFSAVTPESNTLRDYDNANYIFTYHFPTFDLRYIGGYQQYNYTLNYGNADQAGNGTDVTSFTLPGTGPTNRLVINPTDFLHYQENDAFGSQEVSLQSTDSSPLQWIVGGFYFLQKYSNPIDTTANQANLAAPDQILPFEAGAAVGAPVFDKAAPNPQHYLYLNNYDFHSQDEAGYAQVSYKVTDTIKITGNIRYSADQKWGTEDARYVDFSSTFIDPLQGIFGSQTPSFDINPLETCATGTGLAGSLSCFGGPLAKGVKSIGVTNAATGIISRDLSGSSSAVTGGAGIEWTPTRDIFIYARYGHGYEGVSFNAGGVTSSPEVAPEYINSYEVGYKQNFGHTLSIDVDAFYYDYDDIQLPISVNVNGNLEGAFINAPKSESTGIEFEGVWNPIRDLLITGSYSLDYTEILTGCSVGAAALTASTGQQASNNLCLTDTQDPLAIAPGAHPVGTAGIQSVKGDPLPNAPRNKVAVDVAYTWHFDPGNFTMAGSYSWRDTQVGNVFNRFYNIAPSWDDVDFRAIWSGDHDKYEVIGFVKNAFNTAQYDVGATGQGLFGTANSSRTEANLAYISGYTLAPPRTFGVEVRYKFF
jgi:iron complex outermembrane receptor protein